MAKKPKPRDKAAGAEDAVRMTEKRKPRKCIGYGKMTGPRIRGIFDQTGPKLVITSLAAGFEGVSGAFP